MKAYPALNYSTNQSDHCYRKSRRYLAFPVVFALSFAMMQIFSILAIYVFPKNLFHTTGADVAVCWFFLPLAELLFICLTIGAVQSRLILSPKHISYHGWFSQTTIPAQEIEKVDYFHRHLGRGQYLRVIYLASSTQFIEININEFEEQDENGILCWVREKFDPKMQTGWEQFLEERNLRKMYDENNRRITQVVGFFGMLAITLLSILSYSWGMGINMLLLTFLSIPSCFLIFWSPQSRRFRSINRKTARSTGSKPPPPPPESDSTGLQFSGSR